jgi:hypothetical protein
MLFFGILIFSGTIQAKNSTLIIITIPLVRKIFIKPQAKQFRFILITFQKYRHINELTAIKLSIKIKESISLHFHVR